MQGRNIQEIPELAYIDEQELKKSEFIKSPIMGNIEKYDHYDLKYRDSYKKIQED